MVAEEFQDGESEVLGVRSGLPICPAHDGHITLLAAENCSVIPLHLEPMIAVMRRHAGHPPLGTCAFE